MSSPLAIASVTYVLKDLLNDGVVNNDLASNLGTVAVSALPPDQIETGDNEPNRINLFMYMATHNQGWRNHLHPTHNAKGERISYPPLAIDLHYLMTVYSSDELYQDILLGYGMHLMHEHPVLTRDMIRRSIDPVPGVFSGLPPQLRSLSTSGLADQVEMIKVTPETLNTEELSRLWTAFGAKYRPNAAYKVTVVLIQSEKSTKPSLPVRQRNIYVRPFKQPVLERIAALTPANVIVGPTEKIQTGYRLELNGYQLRGTVTRVKIGRTFINVPVPVNEERITVTIPAEVPTGVHGVQVVHDFLMGSPPEPHSGVSSNVMPIVVSPKLNMINIQNSQADSNGLIKGLAVINIEPAVLPSQKVSLALDEINLAPNTPGNSYGFEVQASALASPPGPTNDVRIPISKVKPSTYLVRVSVDGIETPVTSSGNEYDDPSIPIP